MVSAAWIRATSKGLWRGAVWIGLLSLALSSRAAAATHTWNGAAGNLWSLPSSWTGGAPSAAEPNVVLVFPAETANRNMTNDIPNLTIQSISLADSYQVSGPPHVLTLTGGISTTQGSSSTWAAQLMLTQDQTWTLAGNLVVDAPMHGTATLTKRGTADLFLAGPSDFAGSSRPLSIRSPRA